MKKTSSKIQQEILVEELEEEGREFFEAVTQTEVKDSHVHHNASGSDSVIYRLKDGRLLTVTITLEEK